MNLFAISENGIEIYFLSKFLAFLLPRGSRGPTDPFTTWSGLVLLSTGWHNNTALSSYSWVLYICVLSSLWAKGHTSTSSLGSFYFLDLINPIFSRAGCRGTNPSPHLYRSIFGAAEKILFFFFRGFKKGCTNKLDLIFTLRACLIAVPLIFAPGFILIWESFTG